MKKSLTKAEIGKLRKTVYGYFAQHGRELPWRRDYDPYHIFVSEIMLQQTQVDRVAQKFGPFTEALPDFKSLGRAPLSSVLSQWQGLGYNRRAQHLKRAAEIVMKEHNGALPSSPDLLVKLPGIGQATAASICAFAFNLPTLFLETNIRTVIIHHFFKNSLSVSDDEILPVAEAVLDKKNPRKWYSALMDYGAMLKIKYGNASRKSAHYTRQSKFEGSKRQLRGKIIKLLVESKSVSRNSLIKHFHADKHRIFPVLRELEKEQILFQCSDGYSISH